MADPIDSTDPSDSIKRQDMLRHGLIVALSAVGAGIAVEIPSAGDADSMIHLNVTSSTINTLGKRRRPIPTRRHATSITPQQVAIVIVDSNPPPPNGYGEITKGLKAGTLTHSAYYNIPTPALHQHPDADKTPDPEDAAVPFSSPTTLWVAVAW